MLTTYITDGIQTRFTFNWPYLDRSNIIVMRGEVVAPFSFIDDHTVQVRTIFGEALPEGETLKILRVTPDLVSLIQYSDATMLTAEDLNRARLQCLFLIQERSGGLAGAVGTVIQNLTNEIETISGALDSIAYTTQLLTAGLQTLDELTGRIAEIGNGATALQQVINDTIAKYDAAIDALVVRVDNVESRQGAFQAAVTQQVATLAAQDLAFASRVDTVEAKIDAIDLGQGEDDGPADDSVIAASIISAAIAEAKSHYSQAKQITTLQAQYQGVNALVQVEATARAQADSALAQQITTLQTQIGDNLAQVIQEMKTTIDGVGSTVDGQGHQIANLNAQYTLKVAVQRSDGKQIFAGIGLSATSNGTINQSEIVMQADRLVFSQPGNPDAPLKPIFVAGNVDGSPTMVIPANVMGDRTYPGRLLVDGTIEGRSIKANQVTADHLTAGSVTARELAVSFGSNLLRNTEFTEQAGAIPAQWTLAFTSNLASRIEAVYDLPSFTLIGGHTLGIRQTSGTGNTDITSSASSWTSAYVPVIAGEKYEFSAFLGTQNCAADIQIVWFNSADGVVQRDGGWLVNAAQYGVAADNAWPGGAALALYKRVGGIATAPATAVRAAVAFRKADTSTAVGSSIMLVTHPMLAQTAAGATQLSPYSIGGLQTLVSPSGISTPSLSALSANIGLLRTATTGARTEIDSSQIRVYDSNGVMRVRMGVW
jgi:hypothetical protein